MQSEGVVFDFDGVILDSEPIHYKACIQVLERIGLTFTYEKYCEKYLGLADKEMFPQIFLDYGYTLTTGEILQLIQDKIQAYKALIHNYSSLPIIKGVTEYIIQLAQVNKKLAICSGSTRKEIDEALANIKQGMLKKYFQVIITSQDVKNGKPSPEGYLLAANSLELSPTQCKAIEDSPHGIAAAKGAGMDIIALETTHCRSQLFQADRIVSDFTGLLNTTAESIPHANN